MAPPAKRVPELIRDLFQWVKDSEQHPLFADIPVESLIYAHQTEYYQALQDATFVRIIYDRHCRRALVAMQDSDSPRSPRQKYRKVM